MNPRIIYNTITILIFIAAILHLTISVYVGGGKDIIFILCLLINTLIMRNAVRVCIRQIENNKSLITINAIFQKKSMVFFGIFYGASFSIMPFICPFSTNSYMIKSSLALYLGVHNILTGMCIMSVVHLVMHMLKNEASLNIQLWDRHNSEIELYSKIILSIIIHAAFVCAFAIGCCLFTYFIVGVDFWMFSSFTSLMLITVYVIPHIPLRKKFYSLKKQQILDINKLIQSEFDRQLSNIDESTDIKKLEKLQYLLELTKKAKFNSSFELIKLNTVASLILVPSLPNIIKILINQIVI